jgi:hypothetical protein
MCAFKYLHVEYITLAIQYISSAEVCVHVHI